MSERINLDGANSSNLFYPRVICVDIDGVIATIVPKGRYEEAGPIVHMIASVNQLYDAGHEIVLFTARGSATGFDWQTVTQQQLQSWGVRYDRLLFGKPAADFYVDDKAMLPEGLSELASTLNSASNCS